MQKSRCSSKAFLRQINFFFCLSLTWHSLFMGTCFWFWSVRVIHVTFSLILAGSALRNCCPWLTHTGKGHYKAEQEENLKKQRVTKRNLYAHITTSPSLPSTPLQGLECAEHKTWSKYRELSLKRTDNRRLASAEPGESGGKVFVEVFFWLFRSLSFSAPESRWSEVCVNWQ